MIEVVGGAQGVLSSVFMFVFACVYVCVCVSSDLLDAGLHVDHCTRYATGSHAGLEVDDPTFRHSKHHPRLPFQGGTSSH